MLIRIRFNPCGRWKIYNFLCILPNIEEKNENRYKWIQKIDIENIFNRKEKKIKINIFRYIFIYKNSP